MTKFRDHVNSSPLERTNKDTHRLPERYKNPPGKTNNSPALSFSLSAQSPSANSHNLRKMFFRASALLLPVVALSSLVMAAPEAVARGGDVCSNGVTKCCESTHEVSHALCLCSAT